MPQSRCTRPCRNWLVLGQVRTSMWGPESRKITSLWGLWIIRRRERRMQGPENLASGKSRRPLTTMKIHMRSHHLWNPTCIRVDQVRISSRFKKSPTHRGASWTQLCHASRRRLSKMLRRITSPGTASYHRCSDSTSVTHAAAAKSTCRGRQPYTTRSWRMISIRSLSWAIVSWKSTKRSKRSRISIFRMSVYRLASWQRNGGAVSLTPSRMAQRNNSLSLWWCRNLDCQKSWNRRKRRWTKTWHIYRKTRRKIRFKVSPCQL